MVQQGTQNVTGNKLVQMNIQDYFKKLMDKKGGNIDSIIDNYSSSESDYDDAASNDSGHEVGVIMKKQMASKIRLTLNQLRQGQKAGDASVVLDI